MIPLAKPLLGEEEKRAVLQVIDSGMLAQGKKVAEFEEAFAKYIGVKQAIAVSNGTTALHAALLAEGIGPGDEVITVPFTFIATANAIQMTGATPVFVDVEETTFNLDPRKIEEAITPKTKAILPVHLFGQPVNLKEMISVAQKHHLKIIEDACQAHGAEFEGKKVGSLNTACFSFYPTKNMTTGEGGMITTNSSAVAEKARKIINHGSEKRYYHDFVGYNYRMTDLAAAIGLEQLKKLPEFNQQRRRNAQRLNQGIKEIKGIICAEMAPGHVFHQYTLRVTPDYPLNREQLQEKLKEKGIATAVFYPLPLHQQRAYFNQQQKKSFPVSEKLAKEVLSLPVSPFLKEEEIQYIIESIKIESNPKNRGQQR